MPLIGSEDELSLLGSRLGAEGLADLDGGALWWTRDLCWRRIFDVGRKMFASPKDGRARSRCQVGGCRLLHGRR